MPIRNVHEEFTLFMLEDFVPSSPCWQCQERGIDCFIRTWGRACIACERVLDNTCFLMDPEAWNTFYNDHRSEWTGRSFLGRDRFPFAELQVHVPAVFRWLRRATSTAPAVTFAKLSKVFTVVLNSLALILFFRQEQYGQTLINLLSARVEALVALEDE
ncbi:hypothetical protein C8R46DRAFT_1209090 [Mycena filopes]|nr:hypothetical protein C8R46DRAFT_1209090 [Mycena filopes]